MAHLPFQLPLGPPPPLINPPPQIFGNFISDGMSSFPPDLAAQMFGDGSMLDDLNDTKRRRIARACDMCRKKKIKCDGKMPNCTHCINYKTECVFTQVEKKRAPPKGAKYIEGLENRLGRMESLLRLSGLLSDEDGDTDLGMLEKKLAERVHQGRQASQATSSIPPSPAHATSRHDENPATPHSSLSPGPGRDERQSLSAEPSDKPGEVEALSEMMCSLVTSQTGDTNYTGSASAFSIFSPKGIQWVNEKTGDNSFQQIISNVSIDSNKWTNWKPEVFTDLFARPIFIALPEKAEALSLVSTYFDHLNTMFPLFHRPTFMHLFERQYSNDPYEGPGWWASLNSIFATAHRMRVMSGLVSRDEDVKSWAFIKNAMGVFTELTMRSSDLLGVQALLSMAMFMQGTPNPQPSFMLLAAAIRLSHNIGLHKRGTGFNLNPIEHEQRKRVFWIAYMLDKDLCLRNGRPPAQDDDDVNVDLPDPDPEDGIGNIPLADGKDTLNMFRTVCEFAIIESKVYKRLYASRATKQSDGELLQTIGELDQELEDWKDRIPIEFRPEHEIKASHTPLMLHIVMLHFSYYNCLTTVHRMSVHHGYWTSRLSNYAIQGLNAKPLNPRVFSSAALCTAAARASISLLKYIPANDASCVWMILYFPVSALVTLFGHILQNPLDSRAQSDVKLMGLVITFFHSLGQEADTGGVQRMLGVCVEFERVARIFIAQAERDSHPRRKRKNQDPPAPPARTSPSAATTPQPNTPTPQHHVHTTATPPQTTMRQSSNTPVAVYHSPNGSQLSPGSMAAHRQQQQQHTAYSSPAQSPPSMEQMMSQQIPQQQMHQHQHQQQQHQQHHQQQHQHQNHYQQQHQNPVYNNPYQPQHIPQHHHQIPPPPSMDQWPSVQDFNMPGQPDYMSFADLTGFGPNGLQSPHMDWESGADMPPPFQGGQVLLPQDLTTLPMTLDWDWAEMSGGAYPSVENGNFANTR